MRTKEQLIFAQALRGMFNEVMGSFFNKSYVSMRSFNQQEQSVDSLQHDITDYLVQMSQRHLEIEESRSLPALIHVVNDIERIGDLCENLAQANERKLDEKLRFSESATGEIQKMFNKTDKMLEVATTALETNDPKMGQTVWDCEKGLNELAEKLEENHIQRLEAGACFIVSGIVFLDIVSNMEKIGDRLNNVADAVCGPLLNNRKC